MGVFCDLWLLLLKDDKFDLLYILLDMSDDGNPDFEEIDGPPL